MNDQQYIFFASCAKGLESTLELELKEKSLLFFNINDLDIKKLKGGVEFKCQLNIGCLLNEVIKIATRILLRIDTFKVRDFPKLYNKAKKVNWNYYLRGQLPSIETSAFQSRIFDSRKIESTLHKAIKEHYIAQAPKKKYLDNNDHLPKSSVFVRLDNDTCTLSIDLSGERLDLRGYKLLSSNAPIRESLAAAMLYETKLHSTNTETLLDLMSGSGSYSLDSINFYQQNTRRDYYYKWMPIFLKVPQTKSVIIDKKVFTSLYLNDLDKKTFTSLTENFGPFTESNKCHFTNLDIFDISQEDFPKEKKALILNPPYGKRIKTELPIRDFFLNLIKHIENNICPDILGIIIPRELGDFKFKGNVLKRLEFDNGGYPIIFYITRYNS